MNASRHELTLEQLLWAGVMLLAFALRFAALGELPFSEGESLSALGALAASGSPSPFWTTLLQNLNPFSQSLISWLFQLFGSSDAIARVPSAVAGSLLVVAPLLLRKRYGGGLALTVGFLLAVSPIMLAVSRTVGGAAFSLLGAGTAVFALWGSPGAITRERTIFAGLGLGLAIASGGTIYSALLALALTGIVLNRWSSSSSLRKGLDLPLFLATALASAFVLASGIGTRWTGVAGIGESFAAWLQGWSRASLTGAIPYLAMLLTFEPMIIAFGLAGALLALLNRLSRLDQVNALWALFALLIGLLRVGRDGQDLIWILLPLVLLAARIIMILITSLQEATQWLQIIVLSGALLILASSAGVSLVSYLEGYQLSRLGSSPPLMFILFGALLLMAGSLIFIFGMEWSWKVVLISTAISVFGITFSLMVQACWRLNYRLPAGGARLAWSPTQATDQVALLSETLTEASLFETGMTGSIALQVESDLPPSLAWYLSDYARAGGEFTAGKTPPVTMLTPAAQTQVLLLGEYYGQTFALRTIPGPEPLLPASVVRWWVLDEGQRLTESWTLWVRADVAGLGESLQEIEP
jgi:hypothetical protein